MTTDYILAWCFSVAAVVLGLTSIFMLLSYRKRDRIMFWNLHPDADRYIKGWQTNFLFLYKALKEIHAISPSITEQEMLERVRGIMAGSSELWVRYIIRRFLDEIKTTKPK